MSRTDLSSRPLGRRTFIRNGALVLGASANGLSAGAEDPAAGVKFGVVTDLHYADKPAVGSRHYRETPEKLAEAAERLSLQRLEFMVELGDFVDAADSVEKELGYLRRIDRQFAAINPQRHYVLGNHCVHTLTKQEFLAGVERPRSYYSFDQGGWHFIVLDSCFRSDGQPYGRKNFQWTDANIPDAELEWLAADLKETRNRTIVFAHQRLDVQNNYGVKNAAAVRQRLEESGKVSLVLQGHSHKNDLHDIAGIHYCTMVAMVEGSGQQHNGYSVVDVNADGTIRIDGFRKQHDYRWIPK
jgi:alkaline phosphatase